MFLNEFNLVQYIAKSCKIQQILWFFLSLCTKISKIWQLTKSYLKVTPCRHRRRKEESIRMMTSWLIEELVYTGGDANAFWAIGPCKIVPSRHTNSFAYPHLNLSPKHFWAREIIWMWLYVPMQQMSTQIFAWGLTFG